MKKYSHLIFIILLSLLMFVLIGAAVNVPLAVTRLHSRTGTRAPGTLQIRGSEAAAHGWPGPTPHTRPWPDPNTVQADQAWAYTRINAWGPDMPDRSRLFMQVELMGWPLPVLYKQRSSWPDDV